MKEFLYLFFMIMRALKRRLDGNSLYSELKGCAQSEQMAIAFISTSLMNM